MAAGRLVVPGWTPAVNVNGVPIPNAQMFFYLNGTTTLATVYADEALTIPLSNPLFANSAGQWAAVWADDANLFSVAIDAPYGPPGVPFTFDDLGPSTSANAGALNKADRDGANITVPEIFRDYLNIQEVWPEDFGAVGNGIANDWAALQLAVFKAISTGRLLRMTRRYRSNSSIAASGGTLSINGPSSDQARITFHSHAQFKFEGGTPTEWQVNRLTVRGVSFWTQGQSTNAAVRLEYVGGTGGTARTVIFDDVDVRGADGNSGFTYGIDCFNVRNANFSKISVMGDRFTNGGLNVNSLGGMRFDGDSDPVEIKLDDVLIHFVKTGFVIRGEAEGIIMSKVTTIKVGVGIDTSNVGGEPLLDISNSHINSIDYGLVTNGRLQSIFTNTLFYADGANDDWVGCLLNVDTPQNANLILGGLVFKNFGASNATGIVVQGPAGVHTVIIDGNIYDGLALPVWLRTGTNGVKVGLNNIYVDCAATVLDEGTGNTIMDNVVARLTGATFSGSLVVNAVHAGYVSTVNNAGNAAGRNGLIVNVTRANADAVALNVTAAGVEQLRVSGDATNPVRVRLNGNLETITVSGPIDLAASPTGTYRFVVAV